MFNYILYVDIEFLIYGELKFGECKYVYRFNFSKDSTIFKGF